ncbi:hypothetical protein HIM_01144 [Hirsutella minnesotensis 3608]|nr:hypothetical protein HIM_01144 [Hirsutella minnesotensis 3608]
MGSVPAANRSLETRLVTELIDQAALTTPNAVWLEYPRSATGCADGFDVITYGSLANAVNGLAWFLRKNVTNISAGEEFPALAYIGHNDARYAIIAYACIKAGFKVLFSSPRNGVSAHIDLLSTVGCSVLVTTETPPAIVAQIALESAMPVLNLPGLQELLEARPDPFPYIKTYPEARHDPFLVIHTSGSTGRPKPVIYTHEMVLRSIRAIQLPTPSGYKSMSQLFLKSRLINLMPLFHIAGLFCTTICSHYCGTTNIIPSPYAPPTSDTLHELALHARAHWAVVSPATIDSLGRDPKVLDSVASTLQTMAFLGGNPSLTLGKEVAQRIQLCSLIGSSECGAFAQLIPDAHRDMQDLWSYVCINPKTNPVFRPFSNGLHELVIERSPSCEPYQQVFALLSDAQEFRTNDLFTAHPTVEGFWRHAGRIDDILVFSNGEKTNPTGFESRVVAHPDISGALVFGSNRFEAGILIELADTEENESRLLDRNKAIAHVWPKIEEANLHAPAHARIADTHICFVSRDKPMARTAKGTVKRHQTLELYGQEIEETYKNAETLDEDADLTLVDINNHEQVKETIRHVFEKVTGQAVPTDETDFFTLGVDSLHVIRMSRQLRRIPGLGHIEPRLLYRNPCIAALAIEIQRGLAISSGEAHEGQPSKAKRELQTALQEYLERVESLASEAVAEDSDGPSREQRKGSIILTGTTGYVGSYILEELLRHPSRPTVYCLNRSPEAPKVQISRNKERDAALATRYPPDRIKFLTADPSTSDTWGLPESDFQQLKREVTLVIHNAWPVHFVLPLSFFRPSLDGLTSILRFCGAARQKPSVLFISSITSCMNLKAPTIPETLIHDLEAPLNGYGESKFVAEHMLHAAAQALGVKTGVVRVAQVSGAAYSQGLWNRRDWLPRLLLSSKHLGVIPNHLGCLEIIDWIPIDLLARVLVDFAFHVGTKSNFEIYHAMNPNTTTWSQLVPCVVRNLDGDDACSSESKISQVSSAEWLRRLRASASAQMDGSENDVFERNPAVKLVDFFEDRFAREEGDGTSWAMESSAGASTTLRELLCIQPEWIGRWARGILQQIY